MTDAIISSLVLPPESIVNQRVPKKLLVENGAPTAADKRQINEGIEELIWVAALKPNTIGVPEYRDAVREYLEIAVLSLTLRASAKAIRLVELIHRAIPYPVVLVTREFDTVSLSLAHKRWSQGETGKVVLDGTVAEVHYEQNSQSRMNGEQIDLFLKSLALAALPRTHLMAVYQGWVDRVDAFQAARITGRFAMLKTGEQSAMRCEALGEHEHLFQRIAGLRAQAGRELQINRRVELNIEIKRLEASLTDAVKRMQ